MSQQKPVLGYWRLRGLGQPIRFLLHYLEVDYEEKYYDIKPELANPKQLWDEVKDSLRLLLPNLPYFLDGSTKVTEGRAIMKYLCRTRNPELMGKSLQVQTKVDMIDNFMYDVQYTILVPTVYFYTEERIQIYNSVIPTKLGYLTEFIGDNTWATGNDLTYVDFFIAEILHHINVFDSKTLDNFPKLKKYMARFEDLPAIKQCLNNPSFLKTPVYGPNFAHKM